MDIPNMMLRDDVAPPSVLPDVESVSGASELRKQQAAKDFESVLLERVLSQMKNTIGDWGFEKDGTSKQVDGLFWSCLARGVADKGGLGLWKDIYKFLNNSDASAKTTTTTTESVG
jgi:Rod binding domain-containing protein